MPESVKETIQRLLKLSQIDEKLTLLEKRIKDGPRLIANRARDLTEIQDAVGGKQEEITRAKLENKSHEVELKSKEEAIKKLEIHLLTAKTNQEYSTLQSEIRHRKEEMGKLEEAILEFLDTLEGKARDLKRLEGEREIQRKEIEEFKSQIAEDMAEYGREIEAVKAKREEVFDSIDFDTAQIYSKVKSARDGNAVVCADGSTCGGCYMTVTPNDIARLRSMNEIVSCKSCQRILYLSDTVA